MARFPAGDRALAGALPEQQPTKVATQPSSQDFGGRTKVATKAATKVGMMRFLALDHALALDHGRAAVWALPASNSIHVIRAIRGSEEVRKFGFPKTTQPP